MSSRIPASSPDGIAMSSGECHPPVRLIRGLALTLTLCLAALSPATAGAASTEHVFDPILSLSGGCETKKSDPVPDPGLCPMPPGVAGIDHPPQQFDHSLTGVAVGAGGYLYVSSFPEGRIDIFNPAGEYLTEVKGEFGVGRLAVDSACRVYAVSFESQSHLYRYTPSSCPQTKTTTYAAPVQISTGGVLQAYLATDPSNDHFFVSEERLSGLVQHNPDGGVDGVNEVQRLAIDATGGSFNSRVFKGPGAAGSGDLTSGSTTVASVVAAAGSGNVKSGSTLVTSLTTTTGTFEVGEPVAGSGIPSGTTVAEVSHGSTSGALRLSQAATTSANGVSLVSHGLGSFAQGQEVFALGVPDGTTITELKPEFDRLVLSQPAMVTASGASVSAGSNETAISTGGAGSGALETGSAIVSSFASARGTGTLSTGSTLVGSVSTTSGTFRVGQSISGSGIPAGTTVTAVSPSQLQLSEPVTASQSGVSLTATDPIAKGEEVSGSGIPSGTTVESLSGTTITLSAGATESGTGELSFAIPFDASAETVQEALEAVPTIGAGNVSVSGGPGGAGATNPYLVSFQGALASTDVAQFGTEGAGLSGAGASASVTTSVPGYEGTFGETSVKTGFQGVAVDAKTGELFVAAYAPGESPSTPKKDSVYVFDLADGHLERHVDGADLPTPEAGFPHSGPLPIAIDEASGELFADGMETTGHVYRLVRDGEGEYHYLADPQLESHSYPGGSFSFIAVDNDSASPNHRHVFITAETSPGHVWAFGPPLEIGPPIVSATRAGQIATTEATLSALLNPNGATTAYHFQYVPESTFENDVEELGPGHGFDHAQSTAAGELPTGNQPQKVEAPIASLEPGTAYRFRLVASNHCEPSSPETVCTTEGELSEETKGEEVTHRFAIYPEAHVFGPCPNEALRTGPSARLSDCRAYELVSPPNTNGREPIGFELGNGGDGFETQLASADGEHVLFTTFGGSLPGIEGNGVNDGYRANRTGSGWQVESTGPSGAQSQAPQSGGASAASGYWFWKTTAPNGSEGDHGSLVIEGKETHYLRTPGSGFQLLGEGPLGIDPEAKGKLIPPGGEHVIFSSQKPLAEGAPAEGRTGIYDRTSDGALHVLSLEPGPEGTPPPGAVVAYQGASADGSAVAFSVNEGGVKTLYERRDDATTRTVAQGETAFAGLSADGSRLTYLKGGDLFSFAWESETSTQVGSGGESTVVNVSADGSHVYFVSPKVLGEASGAVEGDDNLYAWDTETEGLAFVAVLTPLDLSGPGGTKYALGHWLAEVNSASQFTGLGNDPSRTTPDGNVLVFESHADLTAYETRGHSEVYRYDASSGQLSCLSCNPTLVPASSDAHLQTPWGGGEAQAPTIAMEPIRNVTDDGRRVFFESSEALVPGDADGVQDVYEWRAQGTTGCEAREGCLALISSGHSAFPNYLYSVTPNGHDAFVYTADLLVAQDPDETPSIYDARVEGGFPQPSGPGGDCLGEACQPAAVAPSDQTPASSAFEGAGNVSAQGTTARCAKGKRSVHRRGKARCVAAHHRKRKGNGRAGAKRRVGR